MGEEIQESDGKNSEASENYRLTDADNIIVNLNDLKHPSLSRTIHESCWFIFLSNEARRSSQDE